ncbi:hypothetical protein [Sphingomonas oryzagri]
MRGSIVRCAAASAALLAVAASPPSAKLENVRQHVPLTREQVVSIWRGGSFVYCLYDGYDVDKFSSYQQMAGTLVLKGIDPSVDLTKAGLPADMLAEIGSGYCAADNWKDAFACTGFASLLRAAKIGNDSPPEQSSFARQTLEWVAAEPLGARFDVGRVLDAIVLEGTSASPRGSKKP